MHCSYSEYQLGEDEVGMQKSGGAFEGRHGPEGAVAPHLDGCGL
jgi:hypothetical protein